ncbi:hypothetical protein [Polaromonas sp. YR568]|uniref:hypothetical protein n=1 Tax=Polaromonas sp. YR568 TaxID=1855301 RepID=UPI00398C038F
MKYPALPAHVAHLLVYDEQPASLRDCYDLVALFMGELKRPAAAQLLDDVGGLIPDENARLGYLIHAVSHVAPTSVHETYLKIFERLSQMSRERSGESSPPWPLLRCDPAVNTLDGIAAHWNLRKGLELSKLRQIANRRRC